MKLKIKYVLDFLVRFSAFSGYFYQSFRNVGKKIKRRGREGSKEKGEKWKYSSPSLHSSLPFSTLSLSSLPLFLPLPLLCFPNLDFF